jgi:hypothetical protein
MSFPRDGFAEAMRAFSIADGGIGGGAGSSGGDGIRISAPPTVPRTGLRDRNSGSSA